MLSFFVFIKYLYIYIEDKNGLLKLSRCQVRKYCVEVRRGSTYFKYVIFFLTGRVTHDPENCLRESGRDRESLLGTYDTPGILYLHVRFPFICKCTDRNLLIPYGSFTVIF